MYVSPVYEFYSTDMGEGKCCLKMSLPGTFCQCFCKKAKDVPFLAQDIKILYVWENIHTYDAPYTPFFLR
jgi:hypothetical protein